MGEIEDFSITPHLFHYTVKMKQQSRSYLTVRKKGALKGLGTGAKSAFKGYAQEKYQKSNPLFKPISSSRKEIKAIDLSNATYTLNTTPSFTLLNPVTEGTDFTNRIARKMYMKSIEITAYIEWLRDSAQITFGRLVIVYDRQSNGATPQWADIFTDTTGSSTVMAPINLNNRQRFTVVRDCRLILPLINTQATTAIVFPSFVDNQFMHLYTKMNLETDFLNANGAATDIAAGSLWMVSMGSIASGAEPFRLRTQTRLRFEDPIL